MTPISKGRAYRKTRENARRRSFAARLFGYGAVAIVAGSGVGYLTSRDEFGEMRVTEFVSLTDRSDARDAYYAYCDQVRVAGVAPLYRGDGGYRQELDADGDGVACEPYRGR